MTLEFTFPSDFSAGQKVQQFILDEVEKNNYFAASIFSIRLALEEGIVNAIKHGNKSNPEKNVHVKASVTKKQCKISIEDEGTGFDPKCVPDPTAEENLEKCSGRGVMLIKTYMHSAKYSNGGRKLTMTRKNTPDAVPQT